MVFVYFAPDSDAILTYPAEKFKEVCEQFVRNNTDMYTYMQTSDRLIVYDSGIAIIKVVLKAV